ncbi:ankyrin repeat domain-containing protein [Cellulomonas sp. NPDC089187]|uniref:ankyrin repeat domain-containing protein n=1 Tax=Cellulomonas sp. NPDC089187 TaxID=3154970 RepID=UPI0034388DFD
MATLRKTLPKDFAEILRRGDLAEQIAVFDRCRIDAYDGFDRQPALAFPDCSEELTRWLIEHGADVDAPDRTGKTPLMHRAGRGSIEALLAAGAEVNPPVKYGKPSPLASAMAAHNIDNSRLLMAAGADPTGWSAALTRAIQRTTMAGLTRLAPFLRAMIDSGVTLTDQARAMVTDLGEQLEFSRADDPANVDAEDDAAMAEIYQLTGVTPVPRRLVHDGTAAIVAQGDTCQERFDDLWSLLVPGTGAAATLQGEIIRVAGRIRDEILRNGGGNWDRDYRSMREALPRYAAMGTPLADEQIEELARLGAIPAADLGTGDELDRMCALAVAWVERNSQPIPTPERTYRR